MRIAALDLGSNTSLLLVVDIEKGRIQNIVHDELNVTRMGQGVHQNRKLHPEALEEGTNLSGVAPNPRQFSYLFSGFGHSDRRMLQKKSFNVL